MPRPIILIEASTAVDPQRRGIGMQMRTWLEAAPFEKFSDVAFILATRELAESQPISVTASNVQVQMLAAANEAQYAAQLHNVGADALFVPVADSVYLNKSRASKLVGVNYGMEDFYCRNYIAPRPLEDFIGWHETALKEYDGLVTVSQASLQDLTWFFPEYRHKVNVVYPGSSVATITADDSLPQALQDKRYLLVVGYELKKNILRIIEAFDGFKRKTGSDMLLAIVGKPGFGAEQLDTAIDSSPFASDIVRLGYVADSQKKKILQDCHALLALSIYEGFGLSALEALECSKIALVSNNGSLSEVAGQAAYLADPFSVKDIENQLSIIDTLTNNPRQTGIAAQLKKFDQQIQAQKLLEYLVAFTS